MRPDRIIFLLLACAAAIVPALLGLVAAIVATKYMYRPTHGSSAIVRTEIQEDRLIADFSRGRWRPRGLFIVEVLALPVRSSQQLDFPPDLFMFKEEELMPGGTLFTIKDSNLRFHAGGWNGDFIPDSFPCSTESSLSMVNTVDYTVFPARRVTRAELTGVNESLLKRLKQGDLKLLSIYKEPLTLTGWLQDYEDYD